MRIDRPSLPGRTIGAFLALSGLLALAGCGPGESQAQSGPPQAPQVVVSQPVQKTVREWDEYTGRFAAVDLVEIRARVSGYLNSIHFKDGAIVYKDDLLFVIDPRPYQAAVDAAKAGVGQARAQLLLAQRELDRAQDLRRSQAVSQAILDERSAQLQGAQAGLLLAEAGLRTAELDLEFTQVKASVTGRVSRHQVSVGNLVSGGQANSTLLTTIVSLDPIHFYFDADQSAYLRYVRLSQSGTRASSREVSNPVELALPDEEGFRHTGRMDFVENQLDFSTGTIRGRAVFDNGQMAFTPGMFGRIRLVGRGDYPALLLPDSAIGTDQSRRFVMVVDQENTAQYRPVRIGPIIDGLRVVREGIQPTDKVITAGLQRVRPSAKVTPIEQPIQADQQAEAPPAAAVGGAR